MIPATRPVIGKDLDAVRQSFNLMTGDACWLFGMSITRWMQIVRQQPTTPLKDPSLALLVRFLDQHPELSVVPTFPGVAEMFEMVNGIQAVDQKRFSVLFGSEASATYRWLKAGSRQSPAVNRLMHYLKVALMARRPQDRAKMLEDWMKTVQKEGQARGVDDVLKTGQWNPNARAARKTKVDAPANPLTQEEMLALGEALAAKKVAKKKRPAKPAAEAGTQKKPRAARKTKVAAEAPAPAPAAKKSTGPRRVKAAEAA